MNKYFRFHIIALYIMIILVGCDRKTMIDGNDVSYFFTNKQVLSLILAAEKGNVETIKELVAAGVNINTIGEGGITPLTWAILSNNYNGISGLLNNGADPNLSSARYGSVVALAAGGEDIEILEALLKHGGDPDSFNYRGRTPLLTSIGQHRWNNMRLLLKYGGDINKLDIHQNFTPLILAASHGQYEQVYYLLTHGADYKVKDRNSYTVAHMLNYPVGDASPWKKKVQTLLEGYGITFPLPRPNGDPWFKNRDKHLGKPVL